MVVLSRLKASGIGDLAAACEAVGLAEAAQGGVELRDDG